MDDVHNRIDYCPVFKALMDTPPVQRLRDLKQLATADYVYIPCNGKRFEHSLGVAHLAEKMCRNIQKGQPNLNITDKDVLCVKISGLLHDLGHGPFSHVYEDYVNNALPNYLKKNPHLLVHYEDLKKYLIQKNPHLQKHYEGLSVEELMLDPESKWRHEDTSLMLLDAALEHHGLAIDMENLDRPLLQIGDGIRADSMCVHRPSAQNIDPADILTSRDFVFIKECILGKPIEPSPADSKRSGFVGRPDRHQEFLYDIVSNRHNGLDVDKIDYFARDSSRAYSTGDLFSRIVNEAFVAWGGCPQPGKCHDCCNKKEPGKHLMICYPDKMSVDGDLEKFFSTRFRLHQQVYKHKAAMAATLMICDILVRADPFFRIRTFSESDESLKSDGEVDELPISRAMLHKTSYLLLDDHVIDQIRATRTPELREARLIIERLKARDLYKMAAMKSINLAKANEAAVWNLTEDEIAKEILSVNGQHTFENGHLVSLEEDDFIVEKCVMHHGAGQDNPVANVRFLKDKQEVKKLTNPIEELPTAVAKVMDKEGYASPPMQDQFIRVYCRGGIEKQDLLAHAFANWESESDEERMHTENCGSDSDSDDDDDDHRGSVPLTQDSVGSPPRNGLQYDSDSGPSPFPARNQS